MAHSLEIAKDITLKHHTMKNSYDIMAKCAVLLLGGAAIFACSDLSEIEERVDSLDSRITALETQVEALNENLKTINGLLDEEHNPKFDMDAIRSRTLIFSKKK